MKKNKKETNELLYLLPGVVLLAIMSTLVETLPEKLFFPILMIVLAISLFIAVKGIKKKKENNKN